MRTDLNRIAFLFPGQGSQAVGMGLDLYQEYDFIRELFDMAEEITRINISRLCFKGPMEDLVATINLQPAVTAVNLAFFAALKNEGVRQDVSAGHSLGEYSALCASDVVSKQDVFRLVLKRGELMHRESTRHKGTMHAIVGLSIGAVSKLVDEVQRDGAVSIANHNTKDQVVITGAPDQVKRVSSLAAMQGARAVPLRVSGAWHSELVKGAESEFRDFLNTVSFNRPERSIVHNITADIATNTDEIRSIMAKQLCNPVRWYDSMCRLIKERVEVFVEVGPGRVLTGLLKKTVPKDYPCKIYNVSSMKSLEGFLKEVA